MSLSAMTQMIFSVEGEANKGLREHFHPCVI